ncbi:MAG: phospho-N-acetylmuramoyl-pentapeptide-transferase [Rhodobacteraceae bacterium]|nr:phospho-N-acetylmuramoyl-pentapeptide-transferase [Paracoccaceae bacterium]
MFEILTAFSTGGGPFNLFNYITFRAGGALFTSLFIGMVALPWVISFLKKIQPEGQPIRTIGPDHQDKSGTPTMGGITIIGSMIISTLLWAKLDNVYIWATLSAGLAFAAMGVVDDLQKLKRQSSQGLSSRLRLTLGGIIGLLIGYLAMVFHPQDLSGLLLFPVFKDWVLNLSYFFIPFAAFVIVGTANAVNLTDGLDGLAIVPIMISAVTLGIIAYTVGRVDFTEYLDVQYVPGTGELLVIATSLVGAGLGFLWYNAPPAAVFMGDTGSLGLGGTIGAIAVFIKHEIVFAIIGGVFVMEAVSVIIQVFVYRRIKKRVFEMAPIHHHFEKKGWKEPQIVIRFWIIAIVLGLIGLATLKVR